MDGGDRQRTDELFRIGDVARRTGLTVRTLRYYEEIGLLPTSARRAGGQRVYRVRARRRCRGAGDRAAEGHAVQGPRIRRA